MTSHLKVLSNLFIHSGLCSFLFIYIEFYSIVFYYIDKSGTKSETINILISFYFGLFLSFPTIG